MLWCIAGGGQFLQQESNNRPDYYIFTAGAQRPSVVLALGQTWSIRINS